MRSLYDALGLSGAGGVAVINTQAATPNTTTMTTTGAAVDTKGFNTAVLHAYAALGANPSTTVSSTIQATLTECATSGGTYTNANDNTGTQIGGTFTLWNGTTSQASEQLYRIEGLGTNRKRFLKATIGVTHSGTQTFTGYAEILLSRAFNLPVNSGVSNT